MYRKILVPLDGSELSESVLKHAVGLALGCQVPQVVLLRVREPVDKNIRQSLSPELAAMLEVVNQEEVTKYLEGVATRLKGEGVSAETAVASGNPADEILKYSHENGVDLIIMSTHGRTGLSRWAFGSVADKVIRHATVPVLTGPPSGARTEA